MLFDFCKMYSMLDYNSYIDRLSEILRINSTTGMCDEIGGYIKCEMQKLGLHPQSMHKGGIFVDIGGVGNPLYIMVHCDTIGLIIKSINQDGTLKVAPIGGLRPYHAELANINVHTRSGRIYTGTIFRHHSCFHIAPEGYFEQQPSFDLNLCIVLDEDVTTKQDVELLGINIGDLISLSPNTIITNNGYIKSRFIDNKACVAMIMELTKNLVISASKLTRNVIIGYTMYEEVGHGGAWIPCGVKDVLSVDVACVGPDSNSSEKRVTLFAYDSRFPYHYGLLQELIQSAQDANCEYSVDVITPRGGTDSDSAIISGNDVRHGALGPGIRGCHSYERTNFLAITNTYNLLFKYITQ